MDILLWKNVSKTLKNKSRSIFYTLKIVLRNDILVIVKEDGIMSDLIKQNFELRKENEKLKIENYNLKRELKKTQNALFFCQ